MLAKDKLLHIAAGALTGLLAFLIGWYALLVVVVVGVSKEVYDEQQYGGFDWLDTLATFCGGAISTAVIMIVR